MVTLFEEVLINNILKQEDTSLILVEYEKFIRHYETYEED